MESFFIHSNIENIMQTDLSDSFAIAKRACGRCFIQRNLNKPSQDKDIAYKATRRAYDTLKLKFDEKRREDATTYEQLETIKKAKQLCLDAMDCCEACDRERPRIKEQLIDIKA